MNPRSLPAWSAALVVASWPVLSGCGSGALSPPDDVLAAGPTGSPSAVGRATDEDAITGTGATGSGSAGSGTGDPAPNGSGRGEIADHRWNPLALPAGNPGANPEAEVVFFLHEGDCDAAEARIASFREAFGDGGFLRLLSAGVELCREHLPAREQFEADAAQFDWAGLTGFRCRVYRLIASPVRQVPPSDVACDDSEPPSPTRSPTPSVTPSGTPRVTADPSATTHQLPMRRRS